MSGKKKINLSPLPEELDYSKYEVSVTRWDRVVVAVLLVVLVLTALVYFAWSISGPETDIAEAPATELVPLNPSVEQSADSALAEPANAVQEARSMPKTVEDATSESSPDPAASEQADTDLAQSADSQNQGAQQAETSAAETDEQAAIPDVRDNAELALVKVHNKAITRAILTDQLDNESPEEGLPETLTLPASGITKVMLFTDMQGLRGRTLYHDWYRNGERQARVKIPVQMRNQQSFSSKFINLQMTGDWQVKVVDKQENTYVEAAFKVLAP